MTTHDSQTARVSSKNIVDTAAANGSFHTLGKALDAAGLSHILKGEGPYTVFAPTDEAFKKLPKETLENWLKPENKDELIAVLKYHVLPGQNSAIEVGKLKEPTMMQGQTLKIRKDGDRLTVGGSRVTQRDIASSNGVIHAIDTVIVPNIH